MKKKKKESKKLNSKPRSSTDRRIVEEIIRVDHAGEYGATCIYDGQLAVFSKDSKIGKIIQHMAEQELEHIETFEKLIVSNRVRPSILLPLWKVSGFVLGISTALMGKKAAMACTVAVESVIGKHYEQQAQELGDDQLKLKKIIKKFQKDELEHHDIGIKHDAANTLGYNLLTKVITAGCRAAIVISKKI